MSCCGNHQNHSDQGNEKGHSHKMHNWMMILCCVVPIAIAAILLLSGKASNGLLFLLVLLCPLSHMVLMPLMMKKNNKHS